MISYEDFAKIEIKVGKVMNAEKIPDTDKLLRLAVDFVEKDEGGNIKPRQIVSGIALLIPPENLIGRKFTFVTNLEPRMIRGFESQGMILAAGDGENLSLLSVSDMIKEGTKVK